MSTRKRSDEDFDRELASHLELETEQLIEDGVPPEAAGSAAQRHFGNVTTVRERFYEAGRLVWLDHLVQDVRCATRNMRRAPVAAIVAIASLAAGIGATAATLTVRDAVFRKPPPLYDDPAQLSRVQVDRRDRQMMRLGSPVPAALYRTWRDSRDRRHVRPVPDRAVGRRRGQHLGPRRPGLRDPRPDCDRHRRGRDVDPLAACVENQSGRSAADNLIDSRARSQNSTP